jgi:transcriptional regulator with XRE-family HTH domain
MREVYEFSKHIGALRARKQTNVYKLAEQLKVAPEELLRMMDGRAVPTKQVVAGLAKELDSDVRYLEKLAAEIRPEAG